jgi:hypothetical protein
MEVKAMGKILEFALLDKAVSENTVRETPVRATCFPEKQLELGVWDEETRERFRVLNRIASGKDIFVYILRKF